MLAQHQKNTCRHISFPFLSDAYKISTCCFKKEYISTKYTHVNRKFHHHSSFEVHFIIEGRVDYEVSDKIISLESGQIMLILPKVQHKILDVSSNVVKASLTITFGDTNSKSIIKRLSGHPYYISTLTDEIYHIIQQLSIVDVAEEAKKTSVVSARAYNLISSLPFGFFDSKAETPDGERPDARLSDAKQYIKDNINFNITCNQVAQHCYLSVKQLSRIFMKYEGITLMKYIAKAKTEAAEQYLADGELSLKDISEKLGFCNEYYFNTFFKKNSGLSPGDYRRSIKQ